MFHHGQLWNFVRGRPLKKGKKKEALKIKVQMTKTGPKNAIQKTRKGKGTEKTTLGKMDDAEWRDKDHDQQQQ